VKVNKIDAAGGEIHCTVVNSGSLGNKKGKIDENKRGNLVHTSTPHIFGNAVLLSTLIGVNMPGLSVDLPAMSVKDKQDIKWGINNDVS
jgi:pyruvate kinase